MTDAQVANIAIAQKLKAYSDQAKMAYTMLYANVGQAKNAQDTGKITDGRSTIATKLGDDSKLVALENAIKALNDFAVAALA